MSDPVTVPLNTKPICDRIIQMLAPLPNEIRMGVLGWVAKQFDAGLPAPVFNLPEELAQQIAERALAIGPAPREPVAEQPEPELPPGSPQRMASGSPAPLPAPVQEPDVSAWNLEAAPTAPAPAQEPEPDICEQQESPLYAWITERLEEAYVGQELRVAKLHKDASAAGIEMGCPSKKADGSFTICRGTFRQCPVRVALDVLAGQPDFPLEIKTSSPTHAWGSLYFYAGFEAQRATAGGG